MTNSCREKGTKKKRKQTNKQTNKNIGHLSKVFVIWKTLKDILWTSQKEFLRVDMKKSKEKTLRCVAGVSCL